MQQFGSHCLFGCVSRSDCYELGSRGLFRLPLRMVTNSRWTRSLVSAPLSRSPVQCLWAFVQCAGASSLGQSAREQAIVRLLLPRLPDMANQGFRATPRIRCSVVALVRSLAPQPVPLGRNCVFWIL